MKKNGNRIVLAGLVGGILSLGLLPSSEARESNTRSEPANKVVVLKDHAQDVKQKKSAKKAHVVSQKGKKFSVDELKIKKGDVVVIKNDDDVVHNVFSENPEFSYDMPKGTVAQIQFDEAGNSYVQCTIHPRMRMQVKIEGTQESQAEPSSR